MAMAIRKKKKLPAPKSMTINQWLMELSAASQRKFEGEGLSGKEISDMLNLSVSATGLRIREWVRNGVLVCVPRGGLSVGVDGVRRRIPVYFLKKELLK